MIKSIFFLLPSSGCSLGHTDTDHCNSLQCVRCQKYGQMQHRIAERWKGRAVLEPLGRVEQAVKRLEGKGKMKEKETTMTGDAENDREEERKGETKGVTEGKLKYRGKSKRHENKTSFLDKNKKQMRDWKEETHGEVQNERNEDSAEKEKIQGKGGKQEKKKKEKQETQMHYQKPTLFHMDLPANPCWNDYDIHMNEQKLLKLNFELITQEYEKVFTKLQSGDVTGWKNNVIPQGHWCIFPFVDQGAIDTANCRRCPGVAEIILGCLPAMMNDCVFGNAAFSILYPDSHITPHHGPTNLRLRCHLGVCL